MMNNYIIYDDNTINDGDQDAELFFLENEDVLH